MSLHALRCEARLSILRGITFIRTIEIAREVADAELLAARQFDAIRHDDGDCCDLDEPEWIPTFDEIVAAREVINAGWTDDERESRWRFEYVSTRLKRQLADSHYLKEKEGPLNPRDAADCKLYRERHRERLQAQAADPVIKAKRSEAHRQWRERNRLRLKEYQAARREQYNASRRIANAARRDEIREAQRQRRLARLENDRAIARDRYAARRDEINAQRRAERAAKRAELVCC